MQASPFLRPFPSRQASLPTWRRRSTVAGVFSKLLTVYRLLGLVKGANNYGLDPKVAEIFFAGSIEASKIVQKELHGESAVKRQPPFPTVSDLGKDIRPVLNRLTPAMMRELTKTLPILGWPGDRRMIGLSKEPP